MALGESFSFASYSTLPFTELIDQYRTYFEGEKTNFTAGLDLSQASPFELKVWTAARQIPFGTTWSYAQVARHIGSPKAARAVGQALGRNPLPIIIPCHRVLGSDGKITGYAGGPDRKKWLLQHELRFSHRAGTLF